jgi:hypothetical protein
MPGAEHPPPSRWDVYKLYTMPARHHPGRCIAEILAEDHISVHAAAKVINGPQRLHSLMRYAHWRSGAYSPREPWKFTADTTPRDRTTLMRQS